MAKVWIRKKARQNTAPSDIALVFRAPHDSISTGLVSENTATSTVVADIFAVQPAWMAAATFTDVGDPDSKWTITGSTLVLSAALNYGVAQSHNITIRATNTTGTYDKTFTIAVGDTAGAGPVVANQTADFGALTLASAGVWHPVNTGDAIVAPCAITGGTLAGGDWVIEDDGGLKKTTATVSSGTLICSYNGGADTATITINAVANTYSAVSDAEIAAWLALGVATTSGTTLALRAGSYNRINAVSKLWTSETTITGPVVWPPTAFFAYPATVADYVIQIDRCNNLTLAYLDSQGTSQAALAGNVSGAQGRCFKLKGTSGTNQNLTIRNCRGHGTYKDPNGDYVAQGSYVNPVGLSLLSTAPTNLQILSCLFEDVWVGCSANVISGYCRIWDCVFDKCYYDGLATGNSQAGLTEYSIKRCVFTRPTGRGTDIANPHFDCIQIDVKDPGGVTPTDDMNFLTIEQCIYFRGNARGGGHFIFTDGSTGLNCIVDPLIRGNIAIMHNNTHGITIPNIRGGRIYQNVIVHVQGESGELVQTTSPAINLGGQTNSSGTVEVYGNIVERMNNSATNITVDASRNLEINTLIGSPTLQYTDIFVGPDLGMPNSIGDVLTNWAMLTDGLADAAASGPSISDSGPLGSGYMTLPTNMANWPTQAMVSTGASINAAYEVP